MYFVTLLVFQLPFCASGVMTFWHYTNLLLFFLFIIIIIIEDQEWERGSWKQARNGPQTL